MALGFGFDRRELVVSGHIDELVSVMRTNVRHVESLPDRKTELKDRDRRRTNSLRALAGLSLAALPVLTGCSNAPEYNIFGSFFPVWIFSSVSGLVLALGARAVIARTAIAEHLAAPVLFYLSMATFFACMLWLLFYS
jgi:YtcA family